ncbi:MAG TPA: nitroreductase/quinone reductase family protein [Acidimicrobiia bacterium]|nr:nitroreductase/quinone reductase family protein [Acidimicrobiia bacterium]
MEIRLTTNGRRTGRPHEVVLYAWPDGDRLVVVGSYGGRPSDPDWAVNLRGDPRTVVRRGRRAVEHVAREVDGAERDRLWALVTARFPLYETYQRSTDRLIPLFILEPAI